jgi:hypothetical protein
MHKLGFELWELLKHKNLRSLWLKSRDPGDSYQDCGGSWLFLGPPPLFPAVHPLSRLVVFF